MPPSPAPVVYRFKLASTANSIIAWIILMICFLAAVVFFRVSSSGTVVLLVLGFIMSLAINKTATADTEWTIDREGLYLKWLGSYAFVKAEDTRFTWDEIAAVEDFEEKYWNGFKLTLSSGSTRKFYYYSSSNDDFDSFLGDLLARFDEIAYHRPPAGIVTEKEVEEWRKKQGGEG